MQILKTDDPEVARMLAHYHRLRNDRWHATYNAALAGLLAGKNETYQDSANIAEQLANARHGALDPEPTDG